MFCHSACMQSTHGACQALTALYLIELVFFDQQVPFSKASFQGTQLSYHTAMLCSFLSQSQNMIDTIFLTAVPMKCLGRPLHICHRYATS